MSAPDEWQLEFNRAAYAYDIGRMAGALDCGANINSTDLSGRTHLVLAIRVGQWAVVDFLLARGVDPNVAEKSGLTSLHHMVEASGQSSTYDAGRLIGLIEAGANVFATDSKGRTALHVGAASGGSFEALDTLLARGLDIETRDRLGRTPLHHAAQAGAAEAVVWLLERGADQGALDNDGKTPKLHARRAAIAAFEAWHARQAITRVLGKSAPASSGSAL